MSLIGSTTGQRRAEVDVNEKVAENVKVRLTGAVEDSDGYRDQAFLKRQAVAPSVQWDITDKTKLYFRLTICMITVWQIKVSQQTRLQVNLLKQILKLLWRFKW